jgi:hypothetical protein
MSTIPQNEELLKHLFELIENNREITGQSRVFERIIALVLSELFVFGRHTITQQLMSLGLTEQDWSSWYRLFSAERFDYEAASRALFRESLSYVRADELYVVAGDATQTPRSSRKMEGSGWLRNMRTPPFMVGIHAAQRWFNGSWLMPQTAEGYSRAVPVRWQPAFTEKSEPEVHEPLKEWQACVQFLHWLRTQFVIHERPEQTILMVGDGHYDNLKLWQNLPQGVILFARSAKNRVLYQMPSQSMHGNRKYGERAPNPQAVWRERKGWKQHHITVRGKVRHLQVKVRGPYLRKGVADCPLFLIVVRGKKRKAKNGRYYRRQPLPFLVNAVLDETGNWVLPLPLDTLLFWAWQRWEVEVCHRELKTSFGLGHKQCWHPQSAVLTVQWTSWVYSLLLLAGYKTWGLNNSPPVPTRWWRGSGRWSINTLLRSFRAALWGQHHFHALFTPSPYDWAEKETLLIALRNSIYAAMRH